MLVGFSIDDNENEIGTGALLEQLVSSCGFNPKLDVPLCLEYFDLLETSNAYNDLIADVFYQVTTGESTFDGDVILETAIGNLCDLITMSCDSIGVSASKLQGLDLIVTESNSRVVIWFNEEDIKWKQQN